MPVYEYYCPACERDFERKQRISDDPLKTCPNCRSRKVKRMISRTSFVLKGSGWYSDLYSSPSEEKTEKEKSKKTDDQNATVSKNKEETSNQDSTTSKPSKKTSKKTTANK